ncbi:MAG: hypothetical protein M3018_00610, partial [Actinomycetota bacterium]|nr:hypothetical protein [Actinomycetota bacterium]
QFGSELDSETQRTLARGERLVKMLNQAERHPMPVEDQVVQIYAATNGYLDRTVVDKVERFLAELTEWVRGNEPELLKKIAEGDWGEESQQAVEKAVNEFADDFGFDLDEEGHPLDAEGMDVPAGGEDEDSRRDAQRDSDGEGQEDSERDEQKERAPQPA